MSTTNNLNTISGAGEEEKQVKSGQTSPNDGRSVFSGRARSNTEETLVSSAADDFRSVAASVQPIVPVNTPAGGSVAGDPTYTNQVLGRVDTITAYAKPGNTKVASNVLNGSVQGDGKPNIEGIIAAAAAGGVREESLWAMDAEDMAGYGLKRLVQLAKDENERDGSKSVEQYYSEHLSKVIQEAEVNFDAMKLQ